MFVALRELRSAPWRTFLITVTVAMLALVVTFLSALMGGLQKASTSALEPFTTDHAVVVQEMPAKSLSASQLSADEVKAITGKAANDGAKTWNLYLLRTNVAERQAYAMSDPDVPAGTAEIPKALHDDVTGSTITIHDKTFTTKNVDGNPALDHQAVIRISTADAAKMQDSVNAVIVNKEGFTPDLDGVEALSGRNVLNLSGSYRGEQTSLQSMTIMLYAVSALVVGAFFTIWTMQRMNTLVVLGALGCTTRRLVAGATIQALIVLIAGIAIGAGVATLSASALGGAAPVDLSATIILMPALILLVCGLAGAILSTLPITRIQPRQALANTV